MKSKEKKSKKKLSWSARYWSGFLGGILIAVGLVPLYENTILSVLSVIAGVHLTAWGYQE